MGYFRHFKSKQDTSHKDLLFAHVFFPMVHLSLRPALEEVKRSNNIWLAVEPALGVRAYHSASKGAVKTKTVQTP